MYGNMAQQTTFYYLVLHKICDMTKRCESENEDKRGKTYDNNFKQKECHSSKTIIPYSIGKTDHDYDHLSGKLLY